MLTGPNIAKQAVEAAATDARHAALGAGVVIDAAETDADLRALIGVGEAVWGPNGTLAPNELRALVHAGAVVLGAWEADAAPRAPVGFLLGFLGWNGDLHLHSHQTGVLPREQGRGIGFALKLAQREVSLLHGVAEVRWTFDPLIRRNTAFNVRRLGAAAARFLPEFYGQMNDSVNSDDLSDRLEAVWTLTTPLPQPRAAPMPGLEHLLVSRDGWPHMTDTKPSVGGHVSVPDDFARMRRSDPRRARAWRLAVRSALAQAYVSGLCVADVDADGYILAAVRRG